MKEKQKIKPGDTVTLKGGESALMTVSELTRTGEGEGAVDTAVVFWFDANLDIRRGLIPLIVLAKE